MTCNSLVEFHLEFSCGEVETCQCVESGFSTYTCSGGSDGVSSNGTETTFNKYDNCPPSKCVCDQGYCATSIRNGIIDLLA